MFAGCYRQAFECREHYSHQHHSDQAATAVGDDRIVVQVGFEFDCQCLSGSQGDGGGVGCEDVSFF